MLTATPVSPCKDSSSLVVKYLTSLVDVFIAWAYTRTLPDCVKHGIQEYNNWQMLLAKVYVFGDRFNIPGLKTAALHMQNTNDSKRKQPWILLQPPCCEVIKFVHGNLPENDAFLQLLVDRICCGNSFTDAEQGEHGLRSLPNDLLMKIIIQYNMNKG